MNKKINKNFESTSEEEEEEEGGENYLINNNELPDWQLIDEISIKLLEQGIGIFETLQQALPSVVLAKINKIILDEKELNKENINNICTCSQILKLFRLSQFQIEYLLKSQQELIKKIEKIEKLAKHYKKENKLIKKQFYYGPNKEKEKEEEEEENIEECCKHWKRELFKCNECNKIFLHVNFLSEHIQRKHNNNLENSLNNIKPKAIKILGIENNLENNYKKGEEEEKEENKIKIRKSKRGKSQG
ncbi:C2H2-type domain-containing protein [Meloidogyne graminicola]|uniref:C2H2-type domain-containing protein n=1 Tax=Meloidogyne graminicola TaxID=189291 RepID=A0A8S9ZR24_9BILA|nr:C2H2-type domain-containing protein [Meloidogyne graminicola]